MRLSKFSSTQCDYCWFTLKMTLIWKYEMTEKNCNKLSVKLKRYQFHLEIDLLQNLQNVVAPNSRQFCLLVSLMEVNQNSNVSMYESFRKISIISSHEYRNLFGNASRHVTVPANQSSCTKWCELAKLLNYCF